MNVFVLNAGRCGSTTFITACRHIANYTAGHESRVRLLGKPRLEYPGNHIEADNRLSWILGRLDEAYGDNAFYVYLSRNVEDTAKSFEKRAAFGIMKAYREGIMMSPVDTSVALDVARDYIRTVEANIALFLKDKTHTLHFKLENAKSDFRAFWTRINAEGDLESALEEWDQVYNASE